MLSSSIVSTSLPRIVADLGGTQSTLTWMVTGSLLAITITTPVWGKLADLLSRRGLVVAALGIFIVGSAVAGIAFEPTTMIAGRIVQGAGAGGLLTLTQIVLAEIISPRDRGKYMGLFGAVMAVGTIGGPLLGGLITDVFGWRWNFLATIPVAVVSLIVVLLTLKLPARQGGSVAIDYAGALLICAGVSGLLVWASLGGSGFEWISWTSALLSGGGRHSFWSSPYSWKHGRRNRSFP
ncbi:MFS transporter [Arthrobacter sp. StoSoilB22]|uniref:MFS transporter n=1 Tax=Arthrobacter sp. StoSoilB22 TaxID=2830996 RepID=UPI002570345D|nr:MFS transporter [Arthrobacter sp. StoSoilB22]